MNKNTPEYRKYRREISRKHRAAHPEKKLARKAGEVLPKKPCELCLLEGKINMEVEAHHDNYKKPWHVRWLCKKHHEQVDTEKERSKRQGNDKV